ncbi:hypothetical protein [Mesorhizobium sp.]|uniref:hypothetical protein n=1 Tax=Mesorhizobium sp. TaxID=1871066 RepID=UPI002579BB2F|nr:hypothetical protein [Mesorhizobium sp.]
MYLSILSALVGFIFCSVGLVLLVRGDGKKSNRNVVRSSYWFAAAAAIVLLGTISFVAV